MPAVRCEARPDRLAGGGDFKLKDTPLYWFPRGESDFMVSQGKEVRHVSWFAAKNDLNRAEYVEILDHTNGAAHLGAYFMMLAVASRAKPRWHLVDELGRPHSAESLARITRIPLSVFDEFLPRLEQMGVIEAVKAKRNKPKRLASEHGPSAVGAQSERAATYGTGQTGRDGTECDGTERDEISHNGAGRDVARASPAYEKEFLSWLRSFRVGDEGSYNDEIRSLPAEGEAMGIRADAAAVIAANLFKAERCRNKPFGYLKSAFVGELKEFQKGKLSAYQ